MILEAIYETPRIRRFQEALKKGASLVTEELWDSPKALLAAIAQQVTGKHVLILTGGSQEELRLFNDFRYFCDGGSALDFPAWETLPSENVPPSPDIVGDRYNVLRQIRHAEQPLIVLSSLQAALQRLIPKETFDELDFSLKVGDTLPFENLIERLRKMGYSQKSVAADKGEFAVRGGIIDVFPVSTPDPYRIDFFGDEVESIRIYDPVAQRSVRPVNRMQISPGQELELLDDQPRLASLLDYLGKNTLVIFDDLMSLEDRYVQLLKIPGTVSQKFSSIEEFLDDLGDLQKIYLSSQQLEDLTQVKSKGKRAKGAYGKDAAPEPVHFNMFSRDLEALRWRHPFERVSQYFFPIEAPPDHELSGEDLMVAIGTAPVEDFTLYLLCPTDSDEAYLREQLAIHDVTLPPQSSFHRGYLSSGIAVRDENIVLLPLTEITKRYKIRRQKQRSAYHSVPSEMYDLSPGEAVVHLHNGIGIFRGIETRPNNEGHPTEHFLIEYAKDSKLYVPLNQAHLISKYIGSSEDTPKLHTLGAGRWKRTRMMTEQAIMGYASDLLKMYAEREVKGGFRFPSDGLEVIQFESDFPYVETEDQLAAIRELKNDMTTGKSMDRLVCGDVGYGKTEVAMRAAFKAVVDGGKQVAVLVPTTVLAMQHYDNFSERMRNFPVRVAALSRHRTPKQSKEILEGVANGSVDILIGTHRIVSQDVIFKDLGMVIIDEEQRFGVRAKEHLKKIKAGVACLTLSATPIPRTLYMSLIGARDMSTINTPPQDRLPIKTVVAKKEQHLIRNALLRELTRDGQAFFIHNRVESIYEVAKEIQKLLPQAKILVAHGQMPAGEIDTVFHAFRNGEADILVATTIVENGIDIPNANTILIDGADNFGLADLYQLRGRVGRWYRRAYAYLMTRGAHISEIAKKRLAALVEASSGHGGGMKVALRDLEIRGAGDILGTEQSGHVSAVGFHLYCKLLKRTIATLQGQLPSIISDTKVEFPIDARLPPDYVNAESLRMEIYQRLGEAIANEEVDAIWKELKDRFGPPPEPARWLHHLTRIRVFACRNSFLLLKLEGSTLSVQRKIGADTITEQLKLPKITGPADLEAKVIRALKKAFKIK